MPIANIIEHLRTLHVASHLILTATPQGRCYYHADFIKEESEVHRGLPSLTTGK